MKTKNVVLPCNFVGNFKVGDNLIFNCDMLSELCSANKIGQFNKVIVVLVGSIVEAALGEIIYRAQNYNREGVPNIAEIDRVEIATKKIEKFSIIIDVLKKYAVLDGISPDVYRSLHKLRKYRNRIHIADQQVGIKKDDRDAFSNEVVSWTLRLLHDVLKFLGESYPRPKKNGGIGSLTVPNTGA